MNKSKFLKKSLAMLLAILMVVAMIPLSAAADDAPTDPEPTAPSVAAPDVTVNNRNTTKPQQAGDPYTVTVQDATSVSMAWVPVKDENGDPYSAQVVTKRNVTIGVPFNMLDLLQEGEVIEENEENNSVTYQVTFQMLDKDKEVVGEWPLQITVVTTIPNDDATIKTVIANQSFRDDDKDFAFLGIKGVVDNENETITVTLPVGMDPYDAGFGDGTGGTRFNFGAAITVVDDNNESISGVAGGQNIALRKDTDGANLSTVEADQYVRRVFVPTSTYTTVNYVAPSTNDGTGTLVVTARDGRTRNYTVIFEQEEIFETVGVTIGDDSFSWNGTKIVDVTTAPAGWNHLEVEYIIPVDDDVFNAIDTAKSKASLTFKTLGNVVRVEDPNGSAQPNSGSVNYNVPLQSGRNTIGFNLGGSTGFVRTGSGSAYSMVITVKTEGNMDPNETGLVNYSFYKNVKITLRPKSGSTSDVPFLQEFQLNGYDSVWNEFAELPPEFDYWVDYDFEFSTGDGQHPARISAYINEGGAISIPAQDRDLVANSYWAVDKTPANSHRLMKPNDDIKGINTFKDSVGNCYIANVNTEGGTFVLRVWAGENYKDYTIHLKKPSQSTGTTVDAVKLAKKIDGVWTYLQATKSADGRVWTFEVDNATYGLLGSSTGGKYQFTYSGETASIENAEFIQRSDWKTTAGTRTPIYDPANDDSTNVKYTKDVENFTVSADAASTVTALLDTPGSGLIGDYAALTNAITAKFGAVKVKDSQSAKFAIKVISAATDPDPNMSDTDRMNKLALQATLNGTDGTEFDLNGVTQVQNIGYADLSSLNWEDNSGNIECEVEFKNGSAVLATATLTWSGTIDNVPRSIKGVTIASTEIAKFVFDGTIDFAYRDINSDQADNPIIDADTPANNLAAALSTTPAGFAPGSNAATLYSVTPSVQAVAELTLKDEMIAVLLEKLNQRSDITVPVEEGNVSFYITNEKDVTTSGTATGALVKLWASVDGYGNVLVGQAVIDSGNKTTTFLTSGGPPASYAPLQFTSVLEDDIEAGKFTIVSRNPVGVNANKVANTVTIPAADVDSTTVVAELNLDSTFLGTTLGAAVDYGTVFGDGTSIPKIAYDSSLKLDGTAILLTDAMIEAGIPSDTGAGVSDSAAKGWYLIVDSPAGSVVTPGGRYNTKVTPVVGKSTWGVGNGFNEKFPNNDEYDELEEGVTTLADWWNAKTGAKYNYLINMQENGAATNNIDKDGMVFYVKNGRNGTQQPYVIRFKKKAAHSGTAGAELETTGATTGIDEDLVYGGSTVTNAVIVRDSNIVSNLVNACTSIAGAALPASAESPTAGTDLYNKFYNPGYIDTDNAAYVGAIGGHNEFLAADDKVTVAKVPDSKNEFVITVHVPADFRAVGDDIPVTGSAWDYATGAIYFTNLTASSGAKVYRTNGNKTIGTWTGSLTPVEGVKKFVLDLADATQQGIAVASQETKAFVITTNDLDAWKGGVFNKDKVHDSNILFVYDKNNTKSAANLTDLKDNATAIYYVTVIRDKDATGDKLTSVSSASENVTASVNQAQKIVTLNVPASYNWVGTRDSDKYDFELNFTTDSGAILIDAVSDDAFGFRDNGVTIDDANYYDYKNFTLTDLVQQEQDINKWVSAADEPTNATQFFVKDNELFIFNPYTGASQQITGMGDEIKDAFINPSWRLIEDREAELRVYTEGRNNLNTYKLELNILPESSIATLTHVQVDETTAEIDNENRTAKVALPDGTDPKQVRISVGVNGLSTVVSVAGEPYDPNANNTYDITNPIEIVIAAENGTEFKYILTAGEVPTPTPTAGPTDEPTPTPTATPTANPDLPSDIDQVTPTLREDVIKALTNGLMQGGPDGLFYPLNSMKRYEFALVVARATLREEGETGSASDLDKILIERYGDKTCVFSDVTDDNWGGVKTNAAVAAINLVVEKGYMQGTSATTFAPIGTITREQAALTMARVAGLDMTDTDVSNFADASKISSWAKGGVAAAYKAGIMNGTGNDNFTPLRVLQRQEGAAILSRYYVDGNGKPEPTDPDEGEEGGEPTNPDEGEEGGEPTNPDEGEEGGEPTNPDEGEEGGEPTNPDEGEEGGEPTPEPDDNGDDTAE